MPSKQKALKAPTQNGYSVILTCQAKASHLQTQQSFRAFSGGTASAYSTTSAAIRSMYP